MRLYPAWFWALLFFPLGMLALAMAGYLTAAGYFFGRTTLTLFLVVAAAVLYGLAALWMQVRQWRLERIQRAEAAALSASVAAATPGDEAIAVAPPKIDLAMMGEQTRSLLDLTLTVSLLAGLWWIWKDALPALSTIGDIALWSSSDGNGQAVAAVTLSQLAFAIVIVCITWVAVRNVGALLDTLLLQRLEFQADANYAIKVVSRYAITAVGVLLASDAARHRLERRAMVDRCARCRPGFRLAGDRRQLRLGTDRAGRAAGAHRRCGHGGRGHGHGVGHPGALDRTWSMPTTRRSSSRTRPSSPNAWSTGPCPTSRRACC